MSQQILLIEYRANVTKTLKLDLLKYFDLSAVVRENEKDAMAILEILPDIDTALVLAENPTEKTLENIQKHILLNQKKINVISYTANETTEVVIQRLGNFLGKPVEHDRYLKDHSHDGYKEIPLHFFENLTESPVDLYVQLGEGSSSRFIKRVNKLDPFPKTMVKDQYNHGIHQFYVLTEDFNIFMTSLSNAFIQQLTNEPQTIIHVIDAQCAAFDYLNTYAAVLNFDKNITEVVETTIESYVKVFKREKSLAKLIQQVVSKKASINFQGFYLTCLLGHHVYKTLNRYLESKMEKFVMAALFCDLGLERREVFLIHSNTQLISASDEGIINANEVELIRSHARKNADLLKNYPEMPLDVMSLIRHHHGSPDGIGFHDNEHLQISDDDLVLQTTHIFIKYFLNPEYRFDKKEILKKLKERFPAERMKPYWDAIGSKID
jgi:hypothetical protein